MDIQEHCSHLLHEIDLKRDFMISVGMKSGLSHEETVRYSQELDQLIVRFQKNCSCWKNFLLLG